MLSFSRAVYSFDMQMKLAMMFLVVGLFHGDELAAGRREINVLAWLGVCVCVCVCMCLHLLTECGQGVLTCCWLVLIVSPHIPQPAIWCVCVCVCVCV